MEIEMPKDSAVDCSENSSSIEEIGQNVMEAELDALESTRGCKEVNNDSDKDLLDADMSKQPFIRCLKTSEGLTDQDLHVVIADSNLEKIKEGGNKDEVIIKDKEAKVGCEIRIMDNRCNVSKLHLTDGQETVGEFLENVQGSETSVKKESSLSGSVHDNAKAIELLHTVEVITDGVSSDGIEQKCSLKDLGQCSRIVPTASTASVKRKLLVLDVNGLLADIVMPQPKDCRGDINILRRAIFKRPFCDDFLKFCFENFNVAIWKVNNGVVKYLLGDLKDKLLFCWDMTHCTQTGFKTLENRHKPLVCKELKKIWEINDPDLFWKKGDYDESNTLLIDDSPYKALLNPKHTAIFPESYHYQDKDDNSLGPGGDLRVYFEGLLASENVQRYVEEHPYGQGIINEYDESWEFYSSVLRAMSNELQETSAVVATAALPNSISQ